MCVGRIIHDLIPHHIKSNHVKASESLGGDPIIHDFMPYHLTSRPVSCSHLWPEPISFDSTVTQSPSILKEDKDDMSFLHFVKRIRTTSHSCCSNSSTRMDYRVQLQHETRWCQKVEILPGRTNNKKEKYWHNSENRLAGKRKMCDLNVNLEILESSFPLLTETLDDEDSDETSDSSLDSEAYSGPS